MDGNGSLVVIAAISAAGTWALGIAGAIIAFQQLRNISFRPTITAKWEMGWPGPDKNRRLLEVEISNSGGAAGMIERVNVVSWSLETEDEVLYYGWDSREPPVPFILPGKSSAVLVLMRADGECFDGDRMVLIRLGTGKLVSISEIERFPYSLISSRTIVPMGPA